LKGEYHEAWVELAGAAFANVTTRMSSSSLLVVEGKSLGLAYITQIFSSEKNGKLEIFDHDVAYATVTRPRKWDFPFVR
jgi:hypothetical protein